MKLSIKSKIMHRIVALVAASLPAIGMAEMTHDQSEILEYWDSLTQFEQEELLLDMAENEEVNWFFQKKVKAEVEFRKEGVKQAKEVEKKVRGSFERQREGVVDRVHGGFFDTEFNDSQFDIR